MELVLLRTFTILEMGQPKFAIIASSRRIAEEVVNVLGGDPHGDLLDGAPYEHGWVLMPNTDRARGMDGEVLDLLECPAAWVPFLRRPA